MEAEITTAESRNHQLGAGEENVSKQCSNRYQYTFSWSLCQFLGVFLVVFSSLIPFSENLSRMANTASPLPRLRAAGSLPRGTAMQAGCWEGGTRETGGGWGKKERASASAFCFPNVF